jgi:hypothetical protein
LWSRELPQLSDIFLISLSGNGMNLSAMQTGTFHRHSMQYRHPTHLPLPTCSGSLNHHQVPPLFCRYSYISDHGSGMRGNVVDCRTVLQAGRSQFDAPWRHRFFLIWLNPLSSNMALGSTQSLIQMSTSILLLGKERLARDANSLTAICKPTFWKMWKPQHFRTVWITLACHRNTFTLLYLSTAHWTETC